MTMVNPPKENGARSERSAVSGDSAVTVQQAKPESAGGVAITWHMMINSLVPVGYQDETGFHFGEKSDSACCFNWAI